MTDKHIDKGVNLISHCGLYCGACPSFLSDKCDGCRGNSAKSAIVYKKCKIKPCCVDNGFFTCADCTIYDSTKKCKKYNPLILKIASWIESSDRSKSIEMIQTKGITEFLAYMKDKNWVIIKTKDSILNKRLGKKLNEK